jgi:2Fe-2S ferredoxin
MITVYFARNGNLIPVDVDEGMTLMEAARDYSQIPIPEIPADCSGCCACATCHVHIDSKWVDKTGKIDYNTPEIDLLEYEKNFDESKSRLSCQITLTKKHDGIIVHLLGD